jgi:cytoskeleton protein RodZ
MTDNMKQNATSLPESDSQIVNAPPTPGEMLRERRELRALSVQQVADELHLTMHFIRALEDDAYDKLPGDVFARGYLRSYATLLGLDSEKMMHVFNEHVRARQSKLQAARQKRAARRRKDRNLPWIVFSGVAFIGVAIVLWYFNARTLDEGNLPADSVAVTAPPARSPLSTPVGTAIPALANEDDVAQLPTDEDAVELEAEEAGRIILVESAGTDTLELQLSGDSWIAIDDKDDNQIFRDMVAAGDTLQIRGAAPFNILLGDAASAVVTFNGQPIDVSPNIREDNSARFRLGM